MKCKSLKLDGKKCMANAMHKSNYCFRHDKNTKKLALEASSSGGKGNRQYLVLGRKTRLETPGDIKRLMGNALNKLWTGKMPASNPAGSLGYLAKIFLEAFDKSELETRVEELEKRLNQANI